MYIMIIKITRKHSTNRRTRLQRPFPIRITPFRKGVVNRSYYSLCPSAAAPSPVRLFYFIRSVDYVNQRAPFVISLYAFCLRSPLQF